MLHNPSALLVSLFRPLCSRSACLPSESNLFTPKSSSKLYPTPPPPPPQPPPLLYSVLAGATSRGWKSSFGVTRAAIIALVTPNGRASAWEISANPAMTVHRLAGFRDEEAKCCLLVSKRFILFRRVFCVWSNTAGGNGKTFQVLLASGGKKKTKNKKLNKQRNGTEPH